MSDIKEKMYVFYDGRAEYDVDKAEVMGMEHDLDYAIEACMGLDWVIFEYDIKGDQLTNERRVI